MKNSEQEKFGQDAINQFILKSCVFIVPGSAADKPGEVGTGVIVRTYQDHLVILTAKHVAKNAHREEYRLGYYSGSSHVINFVAGILHHPDEVDLALLIFKEDLAAPLKNLALNPDSVATLDYEIKDDDSLMLIGFPANLIRPYEENMDLYKLNGITFWCELSAERYDEKGRLRVEWRDAEHFRTNEPFDLPPPYGISGGPLWRFRKGPKDKVWSPERIGKIVGI